jgi:uncharacterized membrane protein
VIKRNLDLIGILLLIIIVVGSDLITPAPGLLDVVLSLPFILFAPGYVIITALFPEEEVGKAEVIALSIGLSLGIAVIGGLIIYALGAPLNRTNWMILLSVIILFFGFLTLLKRAAFRRDETFERSRLQLGAHQILLMLVTSLILLAAVGIAVNAAINQPSEGFTELWILPVEEAPDTTHNVEIGVKNDEGEPVTYEVELRVDGRLEKKWDDIELTQNDSWEIVYELSPNSTQTQTLVVSLYRADNPQQVFRQVNLQVN